MNVATVTPDGAGSQPVPPNESKTTRELVIRISVFSLVTALVVAAVFTIAFFNEKAGFAIGCAAAVLAAIYAVKTFSKLK